MISQVDMLKAKNLYFLIFIILAIAGGIFLMQLKQAKNTVSNTNAIQVLMTEKGFEPEITTLKQGTTVTFVNNDKTWHWPASDLHPTHTIYPEFDPKQPVEPGKSWAFTFNRIGSWNYHDHLSPLTTGKIIVNE